jgi:hypothetical protein
MYFFNATWVLKIFAWSQWRGGGAAWVDPLDTPLPVSCHIFMLAILNRRTAVLSFTSALLFIYILTGMLVSSFSSSNNQPLPASPVLLTASRAYSRYELLTLCSYNVTPARSVRKAIFSYHLWLPRYLRIHRAV